MDNERWSQTGVGEYEVSDMGRVRRGSRILKPHPRGGYLRAHLSVGGISRHVGVHQLVARAFLGPPAEGHQVAHANGVRSDNRLLNLSYKTPAENEADKIGHGTSQHGERNHWARLTETRVLEIRRRVNAGELQKDLAAEFGVSKMAVSQAYRGKRWGGVKNAAGAPTPQPPGDPNAKG